MDFLGLLFFFFPFSHFWFFSRTFTEDSSSSPWATQARVNWLCNIWNGLCSRIICTAKCVCAVPRRRPDVSSKPATASTRTHRPLRRRAQHTHALTRRPTIRSSRNRSPAGGDPRAGGRAVSPLGARSHATRLGIAGRGCAAGTRRPGRPSFGVGGEHARRGAGPAGAGDAACRCGRGFAARARLREG